MGQIFDRLKRIVQSEAASKKYDQNLIDSLLNSEEDDLSRTINELNNQKQYRKENTSESTNSTPKMDLQRAYSILGLSQDVAPEIIKNAYKSKIKEYHPDRVASLGEELRDLANRKTKEINEAYSFIKSVRNLD